MKFFTVIVCLLFSSYSLAEKKYSNFFISTDLIHRTISREIESCLHQKNVELNLYGDKGSGRKSIVHNYLKIARSEYDIVWLVEKRNDLIYLLSLFNNDLAKDTNITFDEKIIELSKYLYGYNWLLLVGDGFGLQNRFKPLCNPKKLNHIIYISTHPLKSVRNIKVSELDGRETTEFFKQRKIYDLDLQSYIHQRSHGNINVINAFSDIYISDYNRDTKYFLSELKNEKIKDPYKIILNHLLLKNRSKTETMLFLKEVSTPHVPNFIEEIGMKDFLLKKNLISRQDKLLHIKFQRFPEKISYYTRRSLKNKLGKYLSKEKPFEKPKDIETEEAHENYLYFLLENYSFRDNVFTANKNLLFELISYLIYEKKDWVCAERLYQKNRDVIYQNLSNSEIRRILPVFAFGFYCLGSNPDEAVSVFSAYIPDLKEGNIYFEYYIQKAQFLLETNELSKFRETIDVIRPNVLQLDKFQKALFSYLEAQHSYIIGDLEKAHEHILEVSVDNSYASSLPYWVLIERILAKKDNYSGMNCKNIYKRYERRFKFDGYKEHQIILQTLIARSNLHNKQILDAKKTIMSIASVLKKSGKINLDYLLEFKLTKALYYKEVFALEKASNSFRSIVAFMDSENVARPIYYKECYYNLALLHKDNYEKRKYYTKKYIKYKSEGKDLRAEKLMSFL